MEKVFEFIQKNLVIFTLLIIGCFAPGYLTIGIFNRELFVEMDTIKLFSLACAICAPTIALYFGIICMTLFVKDDWNTVYGKVLAMSLVLNYFTYLFPILMKLSNREMTLLSFVGVLILWFAIFVFALMIAWWKITVDNRRSQQNNQQSNQQNTQQSNQQP